MLLFDKTFFTVVMFLSLSHVHSMEGIVRTLSGGGMPHMGEVESCLDGKASMDGDIYHARFNYPWGIVYDKVKHSVYVADCGCPDTEQENDRIRKIDLKTDIVSTTAGSSQGYQDGEGKNAKFMHIAGMALDQKTQKMYVADSANDVIRVVDLATNIVRTFAGYQNESDFIDGSVKDARFNNPQQLELHESVSRLFVGDTDNHAVRVILLNKNPPMVETITGGPDKVGFKDGSLSMALWKHPTGIAYDMHRDVLFVSDHYNHAVRKVDLSKREVTTIVGTGSPGNVFQSVNGISLMNYPEGIVHDPVHDVLYVAEFTNNCVRMITLVDNSAYVLAGGSFGSRDAVGTDAQFYHPTSLDFDPDKKLLYVSDQYNHRIRTVTTLGNTEVAFPSYMKANHLLRVDAYRDFMVHNYALTKALGYASVISCIFILLYCMRRYFSYRQGSFIKSYNALGKHP